MSIRFSITAVHLFILLLMHLRFMSAYQWDVNSYITNITLCTLKPLFNVPQFQVSPNLGSDSTIPSHTVLNVLCLRFSSV